MERQTATTREQSDRLLKCGVPAESADMSIRTITEPTYCEDVAWQTPMLLTLPYSEAKDIYRGDEVVPAWSLSSLLALLPKEIDIDGYPYRISIYYEDSDEPVIGNQWCLYYKPKKHNEKSRIDDVPMYAPDLIECAVQMIIWLINYGYKQNEIEKGGSEHGED